MEGGATEPLCLRHLLLQAVDLNHQYSDLCWVASRIEHICQLLDERLGCLQQRQERCLARLQQLFQRAQWAGLKLQEFSHHLYRRRSWVLG